MDANHAGKDIRDIFAQLRAADLVLGVLNADGDRKLSAVNVHGHFTLFDKPWPDGTSETMVAYVASGQIEPALTERGEPLVHAHVVCPWREVTALHLEDASGPAQAKIGTDVRLNFYAGNRLVLYFFGKSTDPALAAFLQTQGWNPGSRKVRPLVS